MVFNWVETTFETLYYWLAFIFDFKSFKDTADAFEAYFQAAGANLEVSALDEALFLGTKALARTSTRRCWETPRR